MTLIKNNSPNVFIHTIDELKYNLTMNSISKFQMSLEQQLKKLLSDSYIEK